jgi:hypothetical protein
MAKTYWTHRPSRYAFATDKGWEMMHKGKQIIIRPHANLLTKLLEAGYDELGNNRFGETTKVEVPEAPQPVELVDELDTKVPEQVQENDDAGAKEEVVETASLEALETAPKTEEKTEEKVETETEEKPAAKRGRKPASNVNVGIGIDTTDATE